MSRRSPSAEDDGGELSDEQSLLPQGSSGAQPSSSRTSRQSIIVRALPFMIFHFLFAFAELVLVGPLLALYEQSLCVSYYAGHDPSAIDPGNTVPEHLCKLPAIQKELATIRGWKSSFDTLPILLVAIPLGKLADRWDRRKVLAANLLGLLGGTSWIMLVCSSPLKIPLRWVWLASFIQIPGGGSYFTAVLTWALVGEVFREEGERSKAMYYTFAAFYVAELVSSALASFTMDHSPWIGCWMSIGALALALAFIKALPYRKPLLFNQGASKNTRGGVDSFRTALTHRSFLLSIPVFLVCSLRYTVLNIMMQHASLEFGLPLSRTALFYTVTAVVTVSLFMFIVPQGTAYLRAKRGFSAPVLDLGMVRVSTFFLSFGSLCVALSQSSASIFASILVYAAGFGSRVSMLALISHWIEDRARGSFYATAAVVENIGHAVFDPSLQHIYAAVLEEKGFLTSMPFFTASVLYTSALVSAFFMKPQLDTRRYDLTPFSP